MELGRRKERPELDLMLEYQQGSSVKTISIATLALLNHISVQRHIFLLKLHHFCQVKLIKCVQRRSINWL